MSDNFNEKPVNNERIEMPFREGLLHAFSEYLPYLKQDIKDAWRGLSHRAAHDFGAQAAQHTMLRVAALDQDTDAAYADV